MVKINAREFVQGCAEVKRVLIKFRDKLEKGVGPILIRSGSFIQVQAVRNAPVLTGTLRGSIHTSNNPDAIRHKDDQKKAEQSEISNAEKTNYKKGKQHMIIVGTWLNYAHRREIESVVPGTYIHDGKTITKKPGKDHYMYKAFVSKNKISVSYFYSEMGKLIRDLGARAA